VDRVLVLAVLVLLRQLQVPLLLVQAVVAVAVVWEVAEPEALEVVVMEARRLMELLEP
jgi:hypothetical protein